MCRRGGSTRSRRCRSCENFAEARILNTVSLQTEERRVFLLLLLLVFRLDSTLISFPTCAHSSDWAMAVSLVRVAHDERHNYRYVYATIAIFCLLRSQRRRLAAYTAIAESENERRAVAASLAQTG